MFGKKTNQKDPARQILDSKVEVNILKKKASDNLKLEIARARELKAKGKKNAANYTRIGIYYYLLLVCEQAAERLENIESGRELDLVMGGLSDTLTQINQLGQGKGSFNLKTMFSQIAKMERANASGSGRLNTILGDLQDTDSRISQEEEIPAGLDFIDRLINGESVETVTAGKAEHVKKETVKQDPVPEKHSRETVQKETEQTEEVDLGSIDLDELLSDSGARQNINEEEIDLKKLIDNL